MLLIIFQSYHLMSSAEVTLELFSVPLSIIEKRQEARGKFNWVRGPRLRGIFLAI